MSNRIYPKLAALLIFAACAPDRPEPSANFRRPSGLAIVERAAEGSADRSDLFVADSEAQGVRVLQFSRTVDADNQELFDSEFLASPVIFFPLVIPAEGFPTRIAISEDKNRAYVLSPISKQLHVLDARVLPFGASPGEDGARPILDPPFSLESADDGALLPVGLAIVPGGGSTADTVLVAFDALDRTQGVVKAFRFNVSGNSVTPDAGGTESVVVRTAPRDLLLRDGVAITSSALTNFASLITLNSSAPYLGAVSDLVTGGPTSAIIDGKGVGVLLARLDRPSVVLFESTGGTLVRSTKRLVTSFTPEADRTSSAALGLLDVVRSNVAAGAHGRLGRFDINESDDIEVDLIPPYLEDDGLADVIALAHLNGELSFFFGKDLAQATVLESAIDVVSSLNQDNVYLKECATSSVVLACGIESRTDPQCPAEIIAFGTDVGQVVRATYRGAMAYSRTGALGFVESVAGTTRIRLNDTTKRTPFADRLVRPGDRVLFSLELPDRCGSPSAYVDTVLDAPITAIDQDFETYGPNLIVDVATTSSVAAAEACPNEWTLFSYEVYPSTDQVIVVREDEDSGLLIDEVLERVDIVRTASTSSVGATASAPISRIINATMSIFGDFSCTDGAQDKPLCSNDADCPTAVACVGSSFCPGGCDVAACPPGASGCATQYPVRKCSSIEVSVTGTADYTIDFSANLSFEIGAPEDAVFSPQRRSFLISFPGARQIAEGFVARDGTVGSSYIR